MIYHKIKEGIFISRPNRFIAHIEIEGKIEICHVKNTGRCRELLIPGVKVYVEESDNAKRKTKYDLVQVYKGNHLVNIDSQMPNHLVKEWLAKSGFFENITKIETEKRFGDSRFDLYVEYQDKKAWIEVKGVTLEENGIARFPDAPTIRGVKHIRELEKSLGDGYEAWIVFVVQMDGVQEFRPNWKTHEEFGDALLQAQRAGVQILALACSVSEGEIYIKKEVDINLKKE